jgi:cation transport regulator ChaC
MLVACAAACTSWKVAPTLSTCCGETSHSKNYLNSGKDALIQIPFGQENSRSLAFEVKKLKSIQ